MTESEWRPGTSPSLQWIETNWSLLGDALQAYLRASASEDQVAELVRVWQALVVAAQRIDRRLPSTAADGVLAWARGLGRSLPFPVQAVTRQVGRVRIVLETVSLLRGSSHG